MPNLRRLSDEAVNNLRRRNRAGESYVDLSREFKVSRPTITKACQGTYPYDVEFEEPPVRHRRCGVCLTASGVAKITYREFSAWLCSRCFGRGELPTLGA